MKPHRLLPRGARRLPRAPDWEPLGGTLCLSHPPWGPLQDRIPFCVNVMSLLSCSKALGPSPKPARREDRARSVPLRLPQSPLLVPSQASPSPRPSASAVDLGGRGTRRPRVSGSGWRWGGGGAGCSESGPLDTEEGGHLLVSPTSAGKETAVPSIGVCAVAPPGRGSETLCSVSASGATTHR